MEESFLVVYITFRLPDQQMRFLYFTQALGCAFAIARNCDKGEMILVKDSQDNCLLSLSRRSVEHMQLL